jgi:hypothetical protein
MQEFQEKLRGLKLKKARLWEEIQSLAAVSELMFAKFGKTEAEILKVEKEIVRKTENDL